MSPKAEFAADVGPTIRALQAGGALTLRAIAAGLNARGDQTARGGDTEKVNLTAKPRD